MILTHRPSPIPSATPSSQDDWSELLQRPAPLSPKKSLRGHALVARKLGKRIVAGEYRPHAALAEIQANVGAKTSPSTYHKAIGILIAKGLVDCPSEANVRVNPPERWHLLDPDILSWIFDAPPDGEILASLFELRRVIEPKAAALAAERRSDEHLRLMKAALDDMRGQTLSTEAGRQADQLFHAAMLEASQNVFLSSLAIGVGALVSSSTEFKHRCSPLRDPFLDHLRVFDAIAQQDSRVAYCAMTALIDGALGDTKNAVSAGADPR